MSKPVILIGAGENSRVIASIVSSHRQLAGYLDDRMSGKNILGRIDSLKNFISSHEVFVTIGNNQARKKIYQFSKSLGASFINVIHNLAVVEPDTVIGENVFIGALSIINVGSHIGNNVFINTGCIVEHDNTINDNVHLAPGVITGGRVTIGDESFIGLGSRINDHLQIGHNVIVGSGSVVIKDISPNVTAVGIPAKIILPKP